MESSQSPSTFQRAVNVLIVDDDPFFLELLARELARTLDTRASWSVRTVESFTEASARLRTTPREEPLLVVSDFDLGPGRNGVDVLQAVAKQRPDAVRLLMSGSPEERLRPMIELCKPDAFLEKPLRLDGLAREIARWALVANERTRPPAPEALPRPDVAPPRQAKPAEPLVHESEERYRLLVENVRDYAIFLLDPTGHIASWNKGAERIKGYTADDVLGKHFSIFYSDVDKQRDHPFHELQLAIQTGRYEEEGWRVRKDGTLFWANVVITALWAPDGTLRGFAKITRDLTARRRTEENLRHHASELASLMGELEAFNQTVAHDLRGPLRAIIGYATMLRESGPNAANSNDLLQSLYANAIRMGELVEDLLDFSRSTRGDIRRTSVDLSALAKRVGETIQGREEGRKFVLRVQPGMRALADEGMLTIVLENLMGNAAKFSRPTAHSVVEVGAQSLNDQPVFFVRDNGVGFDPVRSDELFRPFHRLHPASQFEGTGIGLATVQRIVARHGGRVWAEGQPGLGATFHFTLAGSGPARTPGKSTSPASKTSTPEAARA